MAVPAVPRVHPPRVSALRPQCSPPSRDVACAELTLWHGRRRHAHPLTPTERSGSGTSAAAFMAGIPQLIVPFMFDQFFWARQSAWLGVGPDPLPLHTVTAVAAAGNSELDEALSRRMTVLLSAQCRDQAR